MIEWFSWVQVVVASCATLLCFVSAAFKRSPSDLTMGALAVVEVLLLAQIVIAILAPMFGNTPTGDPLEFWIYLISAALLPFAAGFWALLERTRWSTVILGVAALAVAIMVYRMEQIWSVQIYVPA